MSIQYIKSLSVSGPVKIGTGTDASRRKKTLTTFLPRHSEILSIRAFIRNCAWGNGQCDLGYLGWVQQDLSGKETLGWCNITSHSQGSNNHSKLVEVEFCNWSG